METYEEIQATLAIDGITLTFSDIPTTILATFGWSTSVLRQEASFAEVEQTDLNFYVATKDLLDNSITSGMNFTIEDDAYTYTLKILRTPINYMANWSRIPATFISKVSK